MSFRQVCLVDNQRLNGSGIDGGTIFFGMVCQDDVEQVIHFRFLKRGYLLRLFLHIVHAQDDMSNHTTMRSKPGTDLSLEFLQFAYIMKQRSGKNQVMITWIEACSQLGNCGNVYGMFKQTANNGSVVSHRCGPS
jgi:hypothetical protein